jgi:D-3-phosphoglycerate dehydrogenase
MVWKVLVVSPIHEEGMRLLRARKDVETIVAPSADRDVVLPLVRDVDALAIRVSKVDAGMIAAAPRLKIISRHGVGVDNIDIAAATAAGVPVTTVGTANAPSVVEHTLAMMLSLAKRLPDFDRAVRTGDYWRKMKLEAIDVAGRTVLIVGLGRIGSRLAVVLNALGMRCLGIDPAFSADQIRTMGCEPITRLADGLPQADFVTLHCPLEPATRGLIGPAELVLMKPTAYVVNCARGGIVDEAALLDALQRGTIMGAGLDVQAEEPPKPNDPLLACDRLILTPHSAATTAEGVVRMAIAVAQNILDCFDGRLDRSNVFNPEIYGRRSATS